MRKLFVLLLAALAVGAVAQDRQETHGKSYAQILAMGFQKWYDFYIKADGGESTASMSQASYLYANALGWRNDKLIAKLPKAVQTRAKSLRKQLEKFNESTLQLGECLTGGGTMWHIIGANADLSLEEMLYGVVGGPAKVAPATVVSTTTKALDKLTKLITDKPNEEFYGEFTKANAQKLLNEAKATYTQVVALAAQFDRKGSDRILRYCYNQVQATIEANP